jgi:hypothetical protein
MCAPLQSSCAHELLTGNIPQKFTLRSSAPPAPPAATDRAPCVTVQCRLSSLFRRLAQRCAWAQVAPAETPVVEPLSDGEVEDEGEAELDACGSS